MSSRVISLGPDFSSRAVELWQRFSEVLGYHLIKDRDFFQWRFKKPNEKYEHFEFYRGRHLIGHCTLSQSRQHRFLVHYFWAPGDEDEFLRMLSQFLEKKGSAADGAFQLWEYKLGSFRDALDKNFETNRKPTNIYLTFGSDEKVARLGEDFCSHFQYSSLDYDCY